MPQLAAFADEISPDLDEQIRVCTANGVTHFELRSVGGVNILDFDADLRQSVRKKLDAAGIGVAAIGSPIGKVKVSEPWDQHFERFKVAVELAEFFSAPLIRLFSYYPGPGEALAGRQAVLDRFAQKVRYIAGRKVTLVHENEKGIYGDLGARCLDLMNAINSPQLRTAFDFANFVQCGERPASVWPLLKPFTAHIHIKDALLGSGKVVPAGQGDGDIAAILADAAASGYSGFLSLEPHLKVAGHSHGETGPELFKVAADALKVICDRIHLPLDRPA